MEFDCGGSPNVAAGAVAPVLGDSLSENPADLPVIPTPLGLEGRLDSRQEPGGKSGYSGALIKGFDGFGIGLDRWPLDSFTSPNFAGHFVGTSAESSYNSFLTRSPADLGLRLGSALLLPRALFPSGVRLSVGASAGMGRTSGDLAPEVGALLRLSFLGVGYSQSSERLTRTLPQVTVSRLSAGLGIFGLYVGYSHVSLTSSASHTTSSEAVVRGIGPRWSVFGGSKWQEDHRGALTTWPRAGLFRHFEHIAFGYEYGEYLHSHSAILQLFLGKAAAAAQSPAEAESAP